MGKQAKLVKKLHRRERKVFRSQRLPDPDRRDKREELMQDSPRVLKVFRGLKRRLADMFGYDVLKHEPKLMVDLEFSTVARFDYDLGAGTDYGLKCTPTASDYGVQPGDYVLFREGDLEGLELQVVAVSSSDFRVEDVATFVSESNVQARLLLGTEKKSFV